MLNFSETNKTNNAVKSKEVIKQEMSQFIENNNGTDINYSKWYVGITDDPQRRLFQEHKVKKEEGPWIYRQCSNCSIAREVEEYLLAKYKTDGGNGGGNNSTIYVYAYKKKSYTNP